MMETLSSTPEAICPGHEGITFEINWLGRVDARCRIWLVLRQAQAIPEGGRGLDPETAST